MSNLSTITALDVYMELEKQCKLPPDSLGITATYASAIVLSAIYVLGIPLELCILPATLRLAKHRSAFLLLLHISLLNIVWLSEYIFLSVEFFAGRHFGPPASASLGLGALLFRWVNFCIDASYIVLAMNRSLAVLDTRGRLFHLLFSQNDFRNNKVFVLAIWLLGLLYSAYVNWFRERRPFRCLMLLSFFEPTTVISKPLLDRLPDHLFYDAVQWAYMACIYIPVLLYVVAFGKLFCNFVRRKMAVHVQPMAINSGMQAAATMKSISLANIDPSSQSQFLNLTLERSRLFLLCFFSQLPYLVSNLSRIVVLKDEWSIEVLAICWQFFGTISHVQQPVLMMLLSREVRREMRQDFARLKAATKRWRDQLREASSSSSTS